MPNNLSADTLPRHAAAIERFFSLSRQGEDIAGDRDMPLRGLIGLVQSIPKLRHIVIRDLDLHYRIPTQRDASAALLRRGKSSR